MCIRDSAVIASQLMTDLSLDAKDLGLLSAAFFYVFAVAQIPIGLFLDRVGARRMMTWLSLSGIAGAVIFARADSLPMGLLGRGLLGAGMACNLMGTLKLLTVWFGANRFATLSGVVFSIGTVGNMAAATPLVFLVQQMGWRHAFLLIAGVNLLVTVALYVVVKDKPPGGGPGAAGPGIARDPTLSNLKPLIGNRDFWIISAGTFVRYGIFAAFQTLWAGPYLMNVIGLRAVHAGNLILLLNVGMILGAPAWGVVSDRIFKTRKRIISLGMGLVSLIMLLMLIFFPGSDPSMLALLFFGFGVFSSAGLLVYTHIKELMPLHMAGTAMTGINFFTMTGSAVFLQGLGYLMQTLYPHDACGSEAFDAVFLLCAGMLVCMGGLYLFAKEKESL